MAEFIFRQPMKNIGDQRIPLMIEIHESLWLEDFKKFEVRDFLPNGKVYEQPESLNGELKVIDKLSKRYYVVSPFRHSVFENDQCLGGYMYLVDSSTGIEVYHHEPVKKSKTN